MGHEVNRSKNKGTAAETAVVRYLRDNGYPLAERRALAGKEDLGDILLCPGMIAEVKAHATVTDLQIERWQAETFRERVNSNASEAWLVVKRPGKGQPEHWMCWYIDDHGHWVMQWLGDAVIKFRDLGWGDPIEDTHPV